MSIAILARTRWGLAAAEKLHAAGQRIAFVATHKAEPFYACGVDEYRAFASAVGARFVDASTMSSRDLISELGDDCRVAISVNWPSILGQDVIAKFPLGILNAHAGDLPRYRGNACPNWAILNGENHVGLCVHVMDAGELDSGPVVLRDRFALGTETDIADIYRWLDIRIPEMLSEAAAGLLNGTVAPVPQPRDPALALRCYPRRPEDGRIDWARPATEIHRLIRASTRPFAGAFAYLSDGRRVTIWRASVFSHSEPFCAVPGQVMLRSDGRPVIACGEGCVVLTDVEIDTLDSKAALDFIARSLRSRLV